jgi:hypothetical protein
MKSNKLKIIIYTFLVLFTLSFSFVDLDPAYIEKFGYGALCVSFKGFPEKDKFDASQYDFRNGKFYVNKGGRIDIRAILPQGKTYGDLLNEYKKQNSAMYKDIIFDGNFWLTYPNYITGGIQVYWGDWPANPSEILKEKGEERAFVTSIDAEIMGWNTSGLKWEQTENNLQSTVGTWLENAEPGWQMYIINTVGWERWRPEDKYWDYDKGKEITPVGYELAPPVGYCILEVK